MSTQAKSAGPSNRRVEHRFPANAEVQVTILYPATPGRFTGHVSDLSKNGLKLEVDTGLPKGSRVQVKMGKVVVYGEVRYCREKGPDTYEAGVQIEDLIAGVTKRAG